MEYTQYAGVSSNRLDELHNSDCRRKSHTREYNYSYNTNRLYEILHNCSTQGSERDEIFGPYENRRSRNTNQMAGLESELINDINVRNRRSKNKVFSPHLDTNIKDIIQNCSGNGAEAGDDKHQFVGDAGRAVRVKKCLTRYITDEEMPQCFSTNYAVTDKNSGRTEIMVQRKPGCSNVIVQNFSTFDAYATFRDEKKRTEHPDSVTHSIMGIVPKPGQEQSDKRNKGRTVYSETLRADNIAPENYWLCPTEESEKSHKRF